MMHQNIVYLVDMRAASMNEQEKEAALLQISKMQEAAKDGLLYTLQTYVAQLQNQLDKLVRRDKTNKDKLFKSNKPL